MNEKEVSEIRRRFRPDKSNITQVRACYVNEKREIVSQFEQSLAVTPQEESERILALLKRTLSGALGKNLIDVEFSTGQVAGSDEHRLLMALRSSSLKDEEAVQALYQKVIGSLSIKGDYLILLTHDTYDVPYRSKDGQRQDDASSEVFSYILCSICPVKMTKPALSYYAHDDRFHSREADWLVAPPELGFLFPAFDDRRANIYNALYYTRSVSENHQELADALFHLEIPMPAVAQKETFGEILGDALAGECSYEVVQSVHDELCGMIEEHKADRESEPLKVSRQEVRQVLESCGVSDEHVEAFEQRYEAEFGADIGLSPKNLVDTRQLELRTPDVTIKVNPERSDLVETRIINGVKYILIRANDGVEVNGVPIHISEPAHV